MLDASENWHTTDEVSWVVLAFGVELLTHPGVCFTTTNNTYSECSGGGFAHRAGVGSMVVL